ncbi:MAG: M23 family metallopeptidase [Candidatus Wukongarchaeota archaeon]|nr:hypothetical protein [Candidatus Wukongarchaeota archaeon]
MTKKTISIFFSVIILTVFIAYITIQPEFFDSSEKESEEDADIVPPVLTVPYVYEENITSVQPYGVPIKYGEGDFRPHLAVDFAGPNGTLFKASAVGVVGNLWLVEYGQTYQLNIIINEKYTLHYCFEPFYDMTVEEKLDSIFVRAGDHVEVNQTIGVLRSQGGASHLDWGLLVKNETSNQYDRVDPALYMSDQAYENANNLYHQHPAGPGLEEWPDLCPNRNNEKQEFNAFKI